MKAIVRMLPVLCLVAVLFCIPADRAQAACKISVRASSDRIVVGDIFYIMVTLSSDEEMKGFDGYFTYDQSYMKYITGGSVSSGNDDEIHIKDIDRKQGATRIKYAIQCEARRAGRCEIALKKPFKVYRMEDDASMTVGAASYTVNILEGEQTGGQVAAGKAGESRGGKQASGGEKQEDGSENQGSVRGNKAAGGGNRPAGRDDKASGGGNQPDGWDDETAGGGSRPTGRDDKADNVDSMLSAEDGEIPEQGDELPAGNQKEAGSTGTMAPIAQTNVVSDMAGLDRTTCLVVMAMALSGLVMIFIMVRGAWRSFRESKDQEPEEDDLLSGYEQEGPPKGGDVSGYEQVSLPKGRNQLLSINPEDKPVSDEPSFDEDEESLEDVLKRVEAKRKWLC